MPWRPKVKLANESFAKLIKATPEEIACQPNTSRGLATITASIGIKRGENVIVNELELGEHLSLDPTQKGG